MAISSKLTSTNINISSGLILPVHTNNPGDGNPGEIVYVSGQLKYYLDGEWLFINDKKNDGSSSDRAADSATLLKQTLGASATNGAYWYKFNDGSTRRLWTDFTTYAPYSFVMATRIWNGSQNQYLTTEENVTQLENTPNNSPPTAHSKLSDSHMNHIISAGTIRWAIVGNGSTFYRLDDNPIWYSNHGGAQTCSYNRGFYDGIATPSSTPSWTTSGFTYQACGGINLGSWASLTGIHTNDNTYFGGYSGNWDGRATPPSPYGGLGGGNSQWSQNGYVLLNW
jgi:hypothetical protein